MKKLSSQSFKIIEEGLVGKKLSVKDTMVVIGGNTCSGNTGCPHVSICSADSTTGCPSVSTCSADYCGSATCWSDYPWGGDTCSSDSCATNTGGSDIPTCPSRQLCPSLIMCYEDDPNCPTQIY